MFKRVKSAERVLFEIFYWTVCNKIKILHLRITAGDY